MFFFTSVDRFTLNPNYPQIHRQHPFEGIAVRVVLRDHRLVVLDDVLMHERPDDAAVVTEKGGRRSWSIRYQSMFW